MHPVALLHRLPLGGTSLFLTNKHDCYTLFCLNWIGFLTSLPDRVVLWFATITHRHFHSLHTNHYLIINIHIYFIGIRFPATFPKQSLHSKIVFLTWRLCNGCPQPFTICMPPMRLRKCTLFFLTLVSLALLTKNDRGCSL